MPTLANGQDRTGLIIHFLKYIRVCYLFIFTTCTTITKYFVLYYYISLILLILLQILSVLFSVLLLISALLSVLSILLSVDILFETYTFCPI